MSQIIELLEQFVRTHGNTLRWAAIAGWVAIGLGSWGLAGRHRLRRWAWVVAGAIPLLFAFEMIVPVRYDITDASRKLVTLLFGEEVFQRRRPLQALIILSLALAGLVLVGLLIQKGRTMGRPALLALLGSGIALFGFVIETVSLHQIDQYYIIYWSFWGSGLLVSALGVLLAWSRLPGDRPGPPPEVAEPVVVSDPGSPHARYRIAPAVPSGAAEPPRASAQAAPTRAPAAPDPLPYRLLRLAIVLAILALPELLRLVAGRVLAG